MPLGRWHRGRMATPVREVKAALASGRDYIAVAREFGLRPSVVWKIERGHTHRNVDVPGFVPRTTPPRPNSVGALRAQLAEARSSLRLAMAWGAALAAEVERLAAIAGSPLRPCSGGGEWAGEEVVYFIANRVGEVKIGTSTSFGDRLRSIRGEAGGGDVLTLLRGGADVERRWHRAFNGQRVSREYFRLSQDQIPPTDFRVDVFADTRRLFLRRCAWCGAEFRPNVSWRAYCSPGCAKHFTFKQTRAAKRRR